MQVFVLAKRIQEKQEVIKEKNIAIQPAIL
jgi:hypothetical protein